MCLICCRVPLLEMLKLAIAPASSPLYGLVLWSPDPLECHLTYYHKENNSTIKIWRLKSLLVTPYSHKIKKLGWELTCFFSHCSTVSRKDVPPSPNLTKTHSTVADNLDDTLQVDVLETTTVITQTVSKLSELTHCPCAMLRHQVLQM